MNTNKTGIRRLIALALSVAIIATTILAITAFAAEAKKTVNLIDGEKTAFITTDAETVGAFLEEQKIVLGENDTVSPSSDTSVSDGMDITLNRNREVIVICDGKETKLAINEAVTKELLTSKGFTLSSEDYIKKYTLEGILYAEIIRVSYETVTENVEVESTTITIYNDEMYQDQINVKKEGQDGITELTYKVRYENGTEVSKVQLSEKVVKIAVDSVKEVGTKARDPHNKKVQSAVIDETSGVIYTSGGEELHYSKIINVTATAYSPASCGKSPSHPAYGITATGMRATYGVIAVDPRIIPLGSKVYITAPDGSWTYGAAVAADTGGAIKGNIIDLCYDTNAECFQFGRRYAKVYILS
ncbi:MAG: G5 domain-containing protein [Clostridia bacterium]|nr:G5 domain-containing protein [Clostridia bacterium]